MSGAPINIDGATRWLALADEIGPYLSLARSEDLRIARKSAELRAAEIADRLHAMATDPWNAGSVARRTDQLSSAESVAPYLDQKRRDQVSLTRSAMQIEVNEVVRQLHDMTSRGLNPDSLDLALDRVAQAEAADRFLNSGQLGKVKAARKKVEESQVQWFRKELPNMIAPNRDFTADNLLVETTKGDWVAQDESPLPIRSNLAAFFTRRIMELEMAPQGPWTAREAKILQSILENNAKVMHLVDESGPAGALDAIYDRLQAIIARGNRDLRENLGPALKAFRSGYPVPARHIRAIEKYYVKVLSADMPDRIRLRFLAIGRTGGGLSKTQMLLPSWDQLAKIKSKKLKWAEQDFKHALILTGGLLFSILIAMGLAMIGLAVPLAYLPTLIAVITTLCVMAVGVLLYNLSVIILLDHASASARDAAKIGKALKRPARRR